MCSECLQTPCHPRCPNAPDTEPIYGCCNCDYGIMEGDAYIETNKGKVCMECLEDMTTCEILELVGVTIERAERW